MLKPRESFTRLLSLAVLALSSVSVISWGVEATSEKKTTEPTVTTAPVVTTAEGVRVETRVVETNPLENIKDNKPEKIASATPETIHTKVENNIFLEKREPATGMAAAAAPAVVSAVVGEVTSSRPMSLTPLAGYTAFQGPWYSHIANRGTVGLILDIPVISLFSIEAEGHFGRFNMSYSGYGRNFNQYSGGANAKLTLGKGLLQPYLGAGMMAVYYEGLGQPGMGQGQGPQSNRVIGAGQIFAGAEINLMAGVAIGARAEFLRPMMNLPPRYSYAGQGYTGQGQGGFNNNQQTQNGEAEADAMSSAFYRLLGTVRVSF